MGGTSGSQGDPERRRVAIRALVQACLTTGVIGVVYFLLPMNSPTALEALLTLVAGLVLVAALLAWYIRGILQSPYPAVRAVSALTITVPTFLILFASLYYLLAAADPAAWSEDLTKMDALYYTVTVFATVGFGDITAVSQAARVATTIQMLAGLVLVGLIARVVVGAVQISWQRHPRDSHDARD